MPQVHLGRLVPCPTGRSFAVAYASVGTLMVHDLSSLKGTCMVQVDAKIPNTDTSKEFVHLEVTHARIDQPGALS